MRRVFYITGTRADFGLMRRTLQGIAADPRLELGLCVTGMHLLPAYGNTINDIEAAGLPIVGTIPVALDGSDGATMAHALAAQLDGMTDLLFRQRPDIVLLLGDRGEMLAGALAALHLNIPSAHIHGGELSGTIDEPVRHAISKLAHYHFTSTAGARERLIRMGEWPERIFVSGAPGLDGLTDGVTPDRAGLCRQHGLDSAKPLALMVFHPVVQEAAEAAAQTCILLDALQTSGCQIIALQANSDSGGNAVRAVLEERAAAQQASLRVLTHLPRDTYLQYLASVDLLAGNSSSGIIEAASFGLPVVNVGSRQRGRERSANVFDVEFVPEVLFHALGKALARGRQDCDNSYGDGQATPRIIDWLATLPLDVLLLNKQNAY